MSVQTDLLNEVSNTLNLLGSGKADPTELAVMYRSLSLAFAKLAVAQAPSTGWAAATGVATRTAFATGAVTLPVLAEHVKALIDDLLAQERLAP